MHQILIPSFQKITVIVANGLLKRFNALGGQSARWQRLNAGKGAFKIVRVHANFRRRVDVNPRRIHQQKVRLLLRRLEGGLELPERLTQIFFGSAARGVGPQQGG